VKVGKRDYALLLLFLLTGLRRNEVFSIRGKDVVDKDGKLVIKYQRNQIKAVLIFGMDYVHEVSTT